MAADGSTEGSLADADGAAAPEGPSGGCIVR
ncbi:MAG: hypothetical protein Ct9H300mP12_01090 [Acidimicrobiales bacterium]|nr:MAG: hypothetical protein Ct9H300mP12_01090 [Acidimicrobiales bacterium]